jgi:hypothetical protein
MKFMTQVGWGKWDSWGFGVNYCHYEHSLTIDFIHWYFYITVWRER